MLRSPDNVTVLGAGVVGLCVARELAGRGLRVTVLEARHAGAGASSAAVGVLSAPTARRSAFAWLCREGYERHAVLSRELFEETRIDVGWRECGCVHLHESPPAGVEREIESWRRAGVEASVVEGKALREVVPGLGPRFRFGVALDREAQVDPARLVEALRRSCEVRGVRVVEGLGELRLRVGAAELEVAPASPAASAQASAVLADLAGEGARAILLACGAWSPDVLGDLDPRSSPLGGHSLAVEPIRGQALEVAHAAPRRIVHFPAGPQGAGYYLVPHGEETVWVGSTVERTGFDARTTAAGRRELLDAAREVLPGLGEDQVRRQWAGLRPKALRPGGPYVGQWPGLPSLWVACGHYRSGILAAPSTARHIAEAMCEGREMPVAL